MTTSQPILPAALTLPGAWVRLDPLAATDVPALASLLREPALYGYGPLWFPIPESAAAAVALASDAFVARQAPSTGRGDGRLTFAVRLADASPLGPAEALVGTSSLSEIDLANQKIHLGGTLYHPSVWGSVVNGETKLLLLEACFERWGFGRVKLQTDARNTRSRAAIAALGAQPEGILRRESRRGHGTFRDVAVFSVLRDEWPAVRERLRARIDARRPRT